MNMTTDINDTINNIRTHFKQVYEMCKVRTGIIKAVHEICLKDWDSDRKVEAIQNLTKDIG